MKVTLTGVQFGVTKTSQTGNIYQTVDLNYIDQTGQPKTKSLFQNKVLQNTNLNAKLQQYAQITTPTPVTIVTQNVVGQNGRTNSEVVDIGDANMVDPSPPSTTFNKTGGGFKKSFEPAGGLKDVLIVRQSSLQRAIDLAIANIAKGTPQSVDSILELAEQFASFVLKVAGKDGQGHALGQATPTNNVSTYAQPQQLNGGYGTQVTYTQTQPVAQVNIDEMV